MFTEITDLLITFIVRKLNPYISISESYNRMAGPDNYVVV